MSGLYMSAPVVERRQEIAWEGHRSGRWPEYVAIGGQDLAGSIEIPPTDAAWCDYLDQVRVLLDAASASLRRPHLVTAE